MSVRSRDRHCICRGNDIQWRSQGSPGFSDPDTAVRIILLEHSNDAFQLGQEPSGWNGLYLLSCSYHYVPRRISGGGCKPVAWSVFAFIILLILTGIVAGMVRKYRERKQ